MLKFFLVFIYFIFSFFPITGFAVSESVLDTRARRLSYQEGQTVSDIVQNLTNDLTTDKEKAYVLAVFIAYQFQKNGYAERELEKASIQNRPVQKMGDNDFLKTRIGTSQDFATLYQELCEAADLESVIITGYAGKNIQATEKNTPASAQVVRHGLKQLTGLQDYRMQRYEASWNAVRLNDKWALVDTYWMIAGNITTAKEVTSHRGMEKYLAQRVQRGVKTSELTRGKRIDTAYFDANPRQFIKTHFPLDEEWQLLTPPVSWRSFLR